jgi:hypothetical protein
MLETKELFRLFFFFCLTQFSKFAQYSFNIDIIDCFFNDTQHTTCRNDERSADLFLPTYSEKKENVLAELKIC